MSENKKKKTDGGKRRDSQGNELYEGETERKDGWYTYRWKEGTKRLSIYSKTLQELREREAVIKRDVMDGLDTSSARLTLNEWNDAVLAVKRHTIKEGTEYSYTQLWKLYVKDSIGKKRLCDIKKKDIELFYLSLLRSGKAPGTIKRVHSLISSALEEAVEDDLVRKNYARGAFKVIPKDKAEKTPITVSQANGLIGFCKDHEEYYAVYPMIAVMLETGVRVSELCGLTWNDLDSKNKRLSISRQLQYKRFPGEDNWTFHVISGAKTEAGNRNIFLSPLALNALADQQKYYMEMGIQSNASYDGISNFIFLSERGMPLNADKVNKRLSSAERAYNKYETSQAKKEEREADLLPHLSAHVLRHSNLTFLSRKGVPLKVIQRRAGHKNSVITSGTYIHTEKDPDYEREEMQKIGSICG